MSRGYGRIRRALLATLRANESAGLRQTSVGLTTGELVKAGSSYPAGPALQLYQGHLGGSPDRASQVAAQIVACTCQLPADHRRKRLNVARSL